MASLIHQNSEDGVFISADAQVYSDTLENFAGDYGLLFPPLDTGLTERVYEQGVRHALVARNDVVGGGPMPWPEGDLIIAGVARLIARKTAREAKIKADAKVADDAIKAANKATIDALAARNKQFTDTPDTTDLLQRLKGATPGQIDTWVANNVTTLLGARNVLAAMLKVMATQIK